MENKITVPIAGMHCRSCELLVEDSLTEVEGVKSSKVNYKKGEAEIYFDQEKPDAGEIEKAIRGAGYALGSSEPRAWLSKNPQEYKDLGLAAIFLVGFYVVAKNFGLTKLDFSGVSNPANSGIVFLVGITAGLSTCMALVGGLILGIAARHSELHPEASALQKFRPHLFFNLGRVGGYAIFGGVLGWLGSALQFSTPTLGIATILVGIVMLVLGIKLLGIFPRLENLGLALPKEFSKLLGIKKEVKEYSHLGSMLTGALTFFLPCGFTQTMQLFAVSSSNSVHGALIMGVFALGTAPGLLGVGALTSLVKGIFARRFFKFAGMLVVILALLNMVNGYNLMGWKVWSVTNNQQLVTSNRQSVTSDQQIAEVQTLQTVFTHQKDIQPNIFTVKVGQPAKFLVQVKENGQGCMSTITLPGLNKAVYQLVAGKNIEIDFTPTTKGIFQITCAMGVPRGTITVE